MEPDAVARSELEPDAEVMASVESGPTERFIIADVTREDAYLTVDLPDAAALPAWR